MLGRLCFRLRSLLYPRKDLDDIAEDMGSGRVENYRLAVLKDDLVIAQITKSILPFLGRSDGLLTRPSALLTVATSFAVVLSPYWAAITWYNVGKNDRTAHPDMERFVAKRMGATTTEIDSSHVPMLSHPDLVIDVIRTAANAVQEAFSAA